MKRFLFLIILACSVSASAQYAPSIAERNVRAYSTRYRVPPELIGAIIDVESGWNPKALSNKGAMGLMQLMPQTARRFGAFQPFDVEQNIAAGIRYVTTLMWEFHGDFRLVVAAYYAGDGWIARKQLSYHNPDVIAYVQAVRARYVLRKLSSGKSPRS